MDSTFLSCLLFKLKYEANVYLAMKCHLKTNLYIYLPNYGTCTFLFKIIFFRQLGKKAG